MSENVSRDSGDNIGDVTFSPFVTIDPDQRARKLARRLSPLRVQFAEFDLPDTPANNLIKRPTTRRWESSFVSNSYTDEDEEENNDRQKDPNSNLEAKSEDSEMALTDDKVSTPVGSQPPSSSNGKTNHTILTSDSDVSL